MYFYINVFVLYEFDPGSGKTQETCLTHANLIVNINYSILVSNI